MPNGKPTATTWSPKREIGGGAHGGRNQIVGNVLRLKHRQIVFRSRAGHCRCGYEPIGEHDLHSLGAEHNVEIGENDASIDNHDSRANAFFHVLAAFCVRFHPTHANNRRLNDAVRLRRRRRKGARLEGVKHRRFDVFLSDLACRRVEYHVRQHHEQREQCSGADPQRPFISFTEASPSRPGRMTGRLAGRTLVRLLGSFLQVRRLGRICPSGCRRTTGAVERYLFHVRPSRSLL